MKQPIKKDCNKYVALKQAEYILKSSFMKYVEAYIEYNYNNKDEKN